MSLRSSAISAGSSSRHSPGAEAIHTESCVPASVKPHHLVPDGRAHPLDLVLSPFVDRELEERAVPAAAQHSYACGRRAAFLELDPLGEPSECVCTRLPLDESLVDLLDLVAWMGKLVCQSTVVRQQQRSGRVGVEPADGNDAGGMGDQTDDRRAALRIAGRRDDPGRLVQEDVGEGLQDDTSLIDLHPVATPDLRGELSRGTVDPDPPRLDQLVGTAARSDPRTRQEHVQSHGSLSSPAAGWKPRERVERKTAGVRNGSSVRAGPRPARPREKSGN